MSISQRAAALAARASSKLSRSPLRCFASPALARAATATAARTPVVLASLAPWLPLRAFATSPRLAKGITPDDEPSKPAPSEVAFSLPELSERQYHILADQWIENALARLEALQDAREDVDVEYSAGVLTLSYGTVGKYVINKQPPNQQIWLSSPVSGPSRYDYVLFGESQQDKEDTSVGRWVNLRQDVTIDDLLFNELGVNLRPVGFE